IIRHYPIHTFSVANRRWMVGTNGDIYHYDYFDPRADRFLRFSIYHVDPRAWRLASLGYAGDVRRVATSSMERTETGWVGAQGWMRELGTMRGSGGSVPVKYEPSVQRPLPLEAPSYFKTGDLESEHMTYG